MEDKTVTQLYVSKSMNKDKNEDSHEDDQLNDLQHIRKKTTNRISLRQISRIVLITKMKSMFSNEIEKWSRSISRTLIPFRKETCILFTKLSHHYNTQFLSRNYMKKLTTVKAMFKHKRKCPKNSFCFVSFPTKETLKIFSKKPIVLEFLLMVNAD